MFPFKHTEWWKSRSSHSAWNIRHSCRIKSDRGPQFPNKIILLEFVWALSSCGHLYVSPLTPPVKSNVYVSKSKWGQLMLSWTAWGRLETRLCRVLIYSSRIGINYTSSHENVFFSSSYFIKGQTDQYVNGRICFVCLSSEILTVITVIISLLKLIQFNEKVCWIVWLVLYRCLITEHIDNLSNYIDNYLASANYNYLGVYQIVIQ